MARIEYFYSAHSAYAYLGAQRLYEICAETGAELVHRPFELSPVVEAQGSLPFRARTQAHVDYFFGRELERWAEWRALPIVPFRPTYHDADYGLAGRMIIALGQTGAEVDALSFAILEAHWRDDADLSDRETLLAIARKQGLDAAALLTTAEGKKVAAAYSANTEAARAAQVFGSPTYVVDGDPFYGQDRLEMVARALSRPFVPNTWQNPSVD